VLNLGNRIDVSVSGIPLGQVAAQFDQLLDRSVLVPTARVRKKVRIRLKGVRVSAAMRALGLTTQKGPRSKGHAIAKRAGR
jgi:hypothetical protein